MANLDAAAMSRLLALLVHDLRNPAATLGANVDFLREVGGSDEDSVEALADMAVALDELKRGLEQVSWIGRWFAGQGALELEELDVGRRLEALGAGSGPLRIDVSVEGISGALPAGNAIVRIVEILLDNVRHHQRRGLVTVRARRDGDSIVIEVEDEATPVAPELRERIFTLEGQGDLKARADGRYGRFAGMLAIAALCATIGATIEASEGAQGGALFRLTARAV